VYALACLVVPGSLITLAAGSLFGVVVGTAVVSLASVTGASLAFGLGRTLARAGREAACRQQQVPRPRSGGGRRRLQDRRADAALPAFPVHPAQLRLRPDEGPLPRLPPRLLDRHAPGHGDVRLPRIDRNAAGGPGCRERRGWAGAAGAVLRRPGG